MPQQSMHSRPGRTSANAGGRRANIDVGGIAGATGALAPTGGVSGTPDINADPVESGYVDPKAGSPIANFTPYQASGWQNLLSRGQAGMQANQLNNAVLLQQMQNSGLLDRTKLENQGKMDVTGLEGANQQHNIVTTGEQSRLTGAQTAQQMATQAKLDADIAYAKAHGISLESVPTAIQMLDPKQMANTGQQSDNSLGLLKLIANAQNPAMNPSAQQNVTSGFNATQFAPAAANMARTGQPLSMGQTAFPMSSFGNQSLQLGMQPGGTTTTVSRDPNNPLAVSTTETPNIKQGGQFQLNEQGQRVIPIVRGAQNNNNGEAELDPKGETPQSPFGTESGYNIGNPQQSYLDNAMQNYQRVQQLRQLFGNQNF